MNYILTSSMQVLHTAICHRIRDMGGRAYCTAWSWAGTGPPDPSIEVRGRSLTEHLLSIFKLCGGFSVTCSLPILEVSRLAHILGSRLGCPI
eukprot:6198848-Pleurochrysis_carterae.AAC.1